MKVVVFGDFTYPWCTEWDLAKALKRLGHQVSAYQATPTLFPEDFFEFVDADKPDMVLGLLAQPRGDFWLRVRDLGIRTVTYHLDLYAGLPRQHLIENWAVDKGMDLVCSPEGSAMAEDVYASYGVEHRYVRAGIGVDQTVRGDIGATPQYDVVFIGSTEAYHPEWPYRQQLLSWLRDTYGPRFVTFGSATQIVRQRELSDVLANTKVVVGDSLCLGLNTPEYWSDRVYEIVGRGGVLIHPRIKGLDSEFTDSTHLLYYDFGDFDELGTLIDWCLKDPEEHRKMAHRGFSHVRNNYTYAHRMREVLAHLETL